MFRVTLVFSVLAFLLFRPYQYLMPGPLYGGDDYSYFAFSSAAAFLEYPSFEKEFVDEAKIPPLSRVGPGLMALPFVAVFSVLDRWEHNPIVEVRTRENIPGSWSIFGSVMAAVFYFWMSCFLIYQGLRFFLTAPTASLSVIFMVLFQGAPLYAFRRPIFSHVYELFIQSAFFYLFVRKLSRPETTLADLDGHFHAMPSTWFEANFRQWTLLGLLSILACLVRQNGAIYAIIWPVLILGVEKSGNYDGVRFNFKKAWEISGVLLAAFLGHSLIKYFPLYYSPEKYREVNALFESSSFMFKLQPMGFYLERLQTIFLGLDWGLVFTAPFLLIGLIGLNSCSLPYKKLWILLALPLLVNIYIIVIWCGQGSWYGYRYLLFAAMPVLAFPLGWLFENFIQKKPALFYGCCLLALLPLMSMMLFEGAPGLWLSVIKNKYGATPWTHPTLQKQVWSFLLNHPFEFAFSIIKAGPAYVIYVVAHGLNLSASLPAKFLKVYPSFEAKLLIKTLSLHLLPWGLYLLLCKREKGLKALKTYPSPL